MSEQKPMNITKETKRIRGVRGNLLNQDDYKVDRYLPNGEKSFWNVRNATHMTSPTHTRLWECIGVLRQR